ncbi:MAG: hypothetical protein V2B14_02025 [bacterium]
MATKLINCKKCGVLFWQTLRNICDECLKIENENINKINKFVRNCDEPFLSVKLISESVKIALGEVEELYRAGRLTNIAGRIVTKCKICGADIKGTSRKGNFCTECSKQVINATENKNIEITKETEVELRKFEKDIVHVNKVVPPEERMKFGFKKSYD